MATKRAGGRGARAFLLRLLGAGHPKPAAHAMRLRAQFGVGMLAPPLTGGMAIHLESL